MKAAIAIVLIIAFFLGIYKIWEYWDDVDKQREARRAEANEVVSPNSIPGLDYRLQQSLLQAQQAGVKTLKQWLDQNRAYVQDPRLAWIEIDYILLISQTDPGEARKVFATVKKRVIAGVKPSSPVFKRVEMLSKTYE